MARRARWSASKPLATPMQLDPDVGGELFLEGGDLRPEEVPPAAEHP